MDAYVPALLYGACFTLALAVVTRIRISFIQQRIYDIGLGKGRPASSVMRIVQEGLESEKRGWQKFQSASHTVFAIIVLAIILIFFW